MTPPSPLSQLCSHMHDGGGSLSSYARYSHFLPLFLFSPLPIIYKLIQFVSQTLIVLLSSKRVFFFSFFAGVI